MRAATLLFVLFSGTVAGAAQPLVFAPSRDDADCVVALEDQLPEQTLFLLRFTPAYFRIVNKYRTPEYFEALTDLREVTEDLLERTIERLGDLPRDRWHITPLTEVTFDPMDACIQAASMMHTEFGMNVFDEGQYGFAEFHFDIANQLITLILDGDRHDRFFRNWLLALGYYLQGVMFLHDSEHASHSFVMAAGGITTRRCVNSVTTPKAFFPPARSTKRAVHCEPIRSTWEKAEELYARAVTADPPSRRLNFGTVGSSKN